MPTTPTGGSIKADERALHRLTQEARLALLIAAAAATVASLAWIGQAFILAYAVGALVNGTLSAANIRTAAVPFFTLAVFRVVLDHALCFPIYRIEKVRRADYIVFDRHPVAYLNALEKLNCAFCPYVNDLIGYVGEIAARTEAYWCPVKHVRRLAYRHQHYAEFADYGDAAAYRKTIAAFAVDASDRTAAHASRT